MPLVALLNCCGSLWAFPQIMTGWEDKPVGECCITVLRAEKPENSNNDPIQNYCRLINTARKHFTQITLVKKTTVFIATIVILFPPFLQVTFFLTKSLFSFYSFDVPLAYRSYYESSISELQFAKLSVLLLFSP